MWVDALDHLASLSKEEKKQRTEMSLSALVSPQM